MPSLKGSHELAAAERVAEKVMAKLSDACRLKAVCGSVRRRRPVVGDVDVIVAECDDALLAKALEELGQKESGGEKLEYGMLIDGVSVDVSVVKAETWGAALMHATGPAGENVRLRAIAKKRGWMLSEYGLRERETGKLIAGATEEEVYAALGEAYVAPEDRDKTALPIRKYVPKGQGNGNA